MIAQTPPWTIGPAHAPDEIADIRRLFLDYAQSLNFSLCFQNFEAELAGLPGVYAPPRGLLLLARADALPIGCIALRPLSAGPDPDAGSDVGEIKRLYVVPSWRGGGLARQLARRVLAAAPDLGYRRLVLNTIADMTAAQRLYHDLGFRPIAPYERQTGLSIRHLGLELDSALTADPP